jgi:hypothetical protein
MRKVFILAMVAACGRRASPVVEQLDPVVLPVEAENEPADLVDELPGVTPEQLFAGECGVSIYKRNNAALRDLQISLRNLCKDTTDRESLILRFQSACGLPTSELARENFAGISKFCPGSSLENAIWIGCGFFLDYVPKLSSNKVCGKSKVPIARKPGVVY